MLFLARIFIGRRVRMWHGAIYEPREKSLAALNPTPTHPSSSDGARSSSTLIRTLRGTGWTC